jgi:drug/metabolite transporter superfamily protein YnfA
MEVHSMIRQRILQVILLLEGLLFLASGYFIATTLWNAKSEGETMMLSLYFALGVFLLIAVRTPSAHRSLIAFAGWANVAHASVMALMAIRLTADRTDLLHASLIFLVIGVPLIVLTPPRAALSGKSTEPRPTSTVA